MKDSILYLVWLLSAIFMYAEYCYFWQLKWYRIDRFRDFLSTKQGKSIIQNRYILLRIGVALLLYIFWSDTNTAIRYSVYGIYGIDIVYVIFRKLKGYYRRPRLSLKAGLIIGGSLGIEYALYHITRDWNLVLLASGFRLIILSLVVILINSITNQIKRVYFWIAEKKLQRYPKLIKIGITGSYGKTSVKELLTQILSQKYRVAATPKNINSDIGISRFILTTDFSNIDICIVEMGAYNKGDIKLVCDIVHPSIGILTAINQQHLSLFGSIENIQKTKYELLYSIPKTGLAITNADNPLCMQYIENLQAHVRTFGIEVLNHPNCIIESVHTHNGKISAEYTLTIDQNQKKISVQTGLIGEHQAINIAPCIIVSEYLGFTSDEIVQAIHALKQPDNAIQIYPFGKSLIIDDSYNSNPDGFKAALDILGTFSADKRKIVITRGMHELGTESQELHEKIGNEISFFADDLVISTPDFADALSKGIIEKYHTTIHNIFETEKLIEFMNTLRDEEAVILIENRVPDVIRKLYKT